MEIISGRALVSDRGTRCSIGFAGYDANGAPHIVTAGHASGTHWRWHGGELGTTAVRHYRPLDARSIRVENGTVTSFVDTFAGELIALDGFEDARPGLRVVRVGAKSRWTVGTVTHVAQEQHYDLGEAVRDLVRTDIRSQRGDSGGPIITEPVNGTARLVGFVSGGHTHTSVTLGQPARQAFEALGLCPQWKIREG